MTTPHDEALAWFRLTLVPGVCSRTQQALLRHFGTPQHVLAASIAELTEAAGAEVASALAKGPKPELLEASFAWLSGAGHSLLVLGDPDYPPALMETADPPCVLYVNGNREHLCKPAFAIVGSRNATPQALRDAHGFARTLSDAGLCIVSGLALGIDAAAHRGGLMGAGSSIAVMGTGPDRIYPAANRALAHTLAEKGCVVTEFPVTTPATKWNFPRRNRLISGLSRGVLVVEAASRSGSLITAHLAAEQNREVFAVPGSIHSALSKGCHELLRDGAKLVESAEDILSELGMSSTETARQKREPSHPLLRDMGFAPISIDQIAARAGLTAAAVSSQLSHLEVDGRVQALAGGWFQRIE
jgi:DNA processing protein